ncbi:hypothetical protein DID80_04710 [Candidatus Marinamargulisbacteria bacterium SCGC AAA071-K20]|nr:hypothetical protein DID80_04710 [Candidatus Marinamargulisbacteria bacterium SCGC AAA071-K20]
MPAEHISDEPIKIELDAHKKPQVSLDNLEDEPWLSQHQMIQLFGCKRIDVMTAINTSIKSYDFSKKELIRRVQHIEKTGQNSSAKTTVQYRIEIVLAVALILETQEAKNVQLWAISRLKDHLVRGASIDKKRLKNREKWKTLFLKSAKQLQE